MVKRMFVFATSFWFLQNGFSQENETFARKGFLKANSTFGFGKYLHQDVYNTNLVSELEYFFDDKLSFKGENILFLSHSSV